MLPTGVGFIAGVVGLIKWGYYPAAAINGYKVTQSKGGGWRVSAAVVDTDAFKLSQRPLMFVAPHENGDWRWPIEEFDISAGRLTARLGPMIE